MSNYTAGSVYQYVDGADFATGTKLPATPVSLTGSSQIAVTNLDDSELPRTYTIRVFNPANPNDYTEKHVTVDRSGCCIKPSAGIDQAICSPRSMGNVLPAGGGESWSAQAANPSSVTITQEGHITGMTANGTYRFILSNTTSCSDTVQIVRTEPIHVTVTPGQCQSATNQYSITGTVLLTNAQPGKLTISDGLVSTTVTIVNSTTTVNYTLSGLPSGFGQRMVMASLSSCGMASVTYTAPDSCLRPVVVLQKLVDKSRAYFGDTITYTLVLRNIGTAPARNTIVWDSTSNGLAYVANSATIPVATTFTQGMPISTWVVDSLAVGEQLSMTYRATADSLGVLFTKAAIPGDTVTICTSIPVKVCAGETFAFMLTAPPGRSFYTWFKDGEEIVGQTTNTLEVSAIGAYSLATDNIPGMCPAFSCCPIIVEEDSLPEFQAVAIAATCLGNVVQQNGMIKLSGFKSDYTYQYSAGNSFDVAHSLSGSQQKIPVNGILVSNLTNPAVRQSYTIRVYNSSGCYTDVSVALTPTGCVCPENNCVPFVIHQTKRPVRIGRQ
ncbi:hypothetical protein GCM10028805_31000 [Spirosoma harenae]